MNYNVTPTQPSNGLAAAELFCGGGLMAVGLKESGFNIVWANDFDKRAVQAYRHNLGDHVVHADITTIDPDDIPDVDVIAGGPPCQDFSVAGKGAGADGERGKLVFTYLDIIEAKKPKAFIFENVKGLIGKRHRSTFEALLKRLEAIGYRVAWKLINAWDYGVAQKRERVFIVGIRKDLGITYQFPEPDPWDYRTQVLRDVIGDLPLPYPNHDPKPLSDRVATKLQQGGYDNYLKRQPIAELDKPSPAVRAQFHKGAPNGLVYANHYGYGIRKDEEPYAHKVPPGGNWRSLSEEEQKEFMKGAYESGGGKTGFLRRADWNKPAYTIDTSPMSKSTCQLHPGEIPNHDGRSYWTPKSKYSYEQANRVQSMDRPSNTIPAHHNSGQPIHPTQAPRRFTIRECLRIQSVPDWYVLPDSLSLSAQYRIVGNGVASRVAWYLGRALGEQLTNRRTIT